MQGKARIGIVGAELGNIQGTGQLRLSVANETEAATEAQSAHEHFVSVGIPFLKEHSSRLHVLDVLKKNDHAARLICPFEQTRSHLATALEEASTGK
jgi:hypothetical protein